MNFIEQSSLFGHCPRVAELFPVHELLIARHLQLWKTWKTQSRFGRILLMKWGFCWKEKQSKEMASDHLCSVITCYQETCKWHSPIKVYIHGLQLCLWGSGNYLSKNQSPRKTSSFLTSQVSHGGNKLLFLNSFFILKHQ